MKRFSIRYTCVFMLVVAALCAGTTSTYAATGRQLAEQAIADLKDTAFTTIENKVTTLSWTWFQVNLYDEQYPLTVDFVGSNFFRAKKVIYLLPGGGVNFRSSFFTPMYDNLAQFFRSAGFLVVGITPREDKVPSGASLGCMEDWGMARHRDDIRKIVEVIQGGAALPYWLLGHSFGAAYALDYAGTYPDGAEKTIALDIYSFDEGDTVATANALDSYDAFVALMDGGQYADPTYADFKSLMFISLLLPNLDSGYSRQELGLVCDGNFTFEGMLYYSLIHSARLPGIHTPLTGLKGDWPLVQGYAAGEYKCDDNPRNDEYSLSYTDMAGLMNALFKIGSGLVPCAVYRDYFAVNANNGAYEIDWEDIDEPVLWINTELGYGENTFGADLIDDATVHVIPGYGHLDVLSSSTAREDVWHLFLE